MPYLYKPSWGYVIMRNFRERSEGRGGFRDRSSGSRFGGRSGGRFGGFRSRDSGRRKPLEMHNVICDKCGKKCQVPFRPTEGKPVYCSECFEKNDGRREQGKLSQLGISSEQFKQINSKLDKIIQALNMEEDDSDDDFDDDSGEDSEE